MNRSEWTAGDDNVVRMLGQAYDPPSVPAEFAQRVQARMLEVAAEAAQQRAQAKRRRPFQNRLSALAGVAAMLGILALGMHFLPRPVAPSLSPLSSANGQQLAAAPSSVGPRTPVVAPGERIVTRRGERRRVALSDGSVLSLNENTVVRHDAARHLRLDAGEIYVEVAPRLAGNTAALFTVATPHREVRAIGTKFLVRADAEGTGVAVTQGQVHVSNWDGLLSAGQQLVAEADAVTPTPRLSYLLDWTRDLVAAATPPLVPPSTYAGGALVAFDPQGQAANLSLRKYHIDVHIEDGFARTTIDQTYFNHTLGRLEGTFFFPLPADASLSRLAMYVNGRLMEGGMVERDYGRIVFDRIVTKMKDPALLEWVDGHTFKMRVFPLEPRQEKRIILSYTQRLPSLYGRWSYRFPAGHSLGAVRDWSFHARVKDGENMDWHCASHTLTPRSDKGDLLLDASAHQVAMDRDLALDLTEPSTTDAVRFSTVTQDGERYLMLRYRPELPGAAKRQRRDWVFLFESSAERDPLLARTQVEIVRTVLANAEHDDTFAVLTADTQVHAFAPSPLRATPENMAAAVAFLEQAHLLGALDLDAGLTAAAELLNHSANPVFVHLGCGQAVLGERRADVLASRLPHQACYVGVAVDKGGASEFMRRAAERCQGYVTEINPDEPVAWRAFDLFATLNTPRFLGVQVADIEGQTRFLCRTSTVAQGEELCAITRLSADSPLPSSVCVTGTLDDSPFRVVLDVDSPRSDAAYLPRTWARLEIDRLLAEDAVKNKNAIIELSKAMYVMTPYTSLLVLENEAMYAQYKVDRGRKDHWAKYLCPTKIPVVYDPPSSNEPNWRIRFDPVTGQPLNPLDDQMAAPEGLNQEGNQLSFFPPATALAVKGSSTLHTRPSQLIINADSLAPVGHDQENNQLGFFPPANALAVKANSTIRTRPSHLIINPSGEDVRLNVPLPPGSGGLGGALPNLDNAKAIGGLSMSIGGMGGISLSGHFSGRSAGTKRRILNEQGGNAVSEAAVAKGLRWLALHQADDGHWSAHDFCHHARTKPLPVGNVVSCNCEGASTKENDILATAAGLLPFLGVGITHKSGKTTNKDYVRTISAALRYLVEHQKKSNGSWEGGMGAHALATTALCEAYGLTRDPQFKRAAQRALNYLAEVQDPISGGWGQHPRRAGDLFVTGWMFLALKSGQMAGLKVPRITHKLADHFLDACESPDGGSYAVRPRGAAAAIYTAIGLLCRQYSGVGPKNRELLRGIERIRALPPNRTTDMEYLFFATQVMHHMAGARWSAWNLGPLGDGKDGMRNVLIARQDKGITPHRPHQQGSWAPDGASRLQGGRVVSTALAVLCLEVYYRHLPLYRRDYSTNKDENASSHWLSSIFHAQALDHVAYPSLLTDAEQADGNELSDPGGEDRFLTGLLALPMHAKNPAIWCKAARAAEQRQQYDSALKRLWQALELDRRRPRSLSSLREDNRWFLELAQRHAQELAEQHRAMPHELRDQVMAVADEWRAVDAEDWRPCWLAGRVLSLAGERELAWSYLTSPSFLRQRDARIWIELARQQHWQDEYNLAERAFTVAASLEPGNAEIVWERALNHRTAGRRAAARTLLRQLAKGTWAERYRDFQFRARRALEEER